MATHNPPQGHEKSAKDTMTSDSINGILGTGGCKAAYRGEQGGDQDLVCPDKEKKKAGNALLQKIFHESDLSCIRSSLVATFSQAVESGTTTRIFLKKNRELLVQQNIDGLCQIRRVVLIKTFPYRYNYIHERQLATLGTFYLKEIFI
jgi:hypothetical protein